MSQDWEYDRDQEGGPEMVDHVMGVALFAGAVLAVAIAILRS